MAQLTFPIPPGELKLPVVIGHNRKALASFLALAAFIGVVVVAILVLAPIVAGEANRLARAIFSTAGNTPPLARRLAATFQAWRDTIYGTGVFPPDVERQLDQDVAGHRGADPDRDPHVGHRGVRITRSPSRRAACSCGSRRSR